MRIGNWCGLSHDDNEGSMGIIDRVCEARLSLLELLVIPDRRRLLVDRLVAVSPLVERTSV